MLRELIRYYLSSFPVTEGKRNLFNFAKKYCIPDQKDIIADMKYNFKLKLNLNNDEHLHYYFYKNHDERYEINNLIKLLNKGDICYDIGANIGFYSFLMAKISGENGKIYSFEPVEHTKNTLEEGIRANNFNNVYVNNFALGNSDEEKEIFFNNSQECNGTASFINMDEKSQKEVVKIKKLDTVFDSLEKPNFIKIDVEGFQGDVIKGSETFFECNQPILMIEIDEGTEKWIEDFFKKLDYKFFKFKKNGLVEVGSIFNNGRNILFVNNNILDDIKRVEKLKV